MNSSDTNVRCSNERNIYITRLIEENEQNLKSFIAYLSFGNTAHSEDVFQETCLVLLGTYDRIDPEKPVFPYLCGVAKMILINMLRKEKRREGISLRGNLMLPPSWESMDDSLCDESGICFIELKKICISDLTESETQTFQDCFINMLSHAEISQKRNISKNSSKMRKSRLAAKLRNITKDWLPIIIVCVIAVDAIILL